MNQELIQDLLSDAPAARLCHLVKWPRFEGYGFNLHAERANPGQFIGKIDPGSPAELAGLKEGDRIIEVNGINIANESHRQVVDRIKSEPHEAKLLVLDAQADAWFKEHAQEVAPSSQLPNVIKLKTPDEQPKGDENLDHENKQEEDEEEDNSMKKTIQTKTNLSLDSIEQPRSRSPPMTPDSGTMEEAGQQREGGGKVLVVRAEMNAQLGATRTTSHQSESGNERAQSSSVEPDSLASSSDRAESASGGAAVVKVSPLINSFHSAHFHSILVSPFPTQPQQQLFFA